MDKYQPLPHEVSERNSEPEKFPNLTAKDQHRQSPTDDPAFLSRSNVDATSNKNLSEDISDQEVRALCLPDHLMRTTTSDDDASDCGGPGAVDRGNELVLVESTSSSPILTGTGIPQQLVTTTDEDGEAFSSSVNKNVMKSGSVKVKSNWLDKVFVEAEGQEVEDQQISASTPDDAVEEVEEDQEKGSSLNRRINDIGGGEQEEGDEIVEHEKSGFSRCVVVAVEGNLADEINGVGNTEAVPESGEKCTCRGEDEEDDDRQSGGEDEGKGAIRSSFNGVQSGEANKQSVVKYSPASCEPTPTPAPDNSIKNRNTASSSSLSTTTTTDNSTTTSVDVLQDDPFSSGGSSSNSTKIQIRRHETTTTTSNHDNNDNNVDNQQQPLHNSAVTKQQTPTSVRTTATTQSGSFGKSEMQLENPKILSKRLQQLFRFCGEGDGDGDTEDPNPDEMQGVDEGDDNDDLVDGVVVVDKQEIAEGGDGGGSMEETPSTSMSSSLNVAPRLKDDPEDRDTKKQQHQDGDDGNEMDEGEGKERKANLGRELVVVDREQPRRRSSAARNEAQLPQQQQQVDEILPLAVVENLQPAQPPLQQQPDFESDTWADCEEVGDESEEICTCQNYSDTEEFYDEDEQLPSKDVDLSGFTQHDLLQESHSTTEAGTVNGSAVSVGAITTPLGRKRKISEAGCSGSITANGGESPCTMSQLYMGLEAKRSRGKYSNLGSPKTPTSTTMVAASSAIPAFLRTPRSAQSMHMLLPKEHLAPEMSLWLVQFQKWTEIDRVMALNHIIDICEPSQVRHVMKVIEPQFQRDFISLLPRELALQVLSYLEPTDLLRAAQTCRNWRFLCDDNLLWKDKCKEGNIIIDVLSDRPKRGRAGNMPPIASPWKAAYMRQHIIELNWRSRPIRTPKVLKGHDDHVITCLQFCGNRIVSGSDDNTLKVWSAVTGKCLRVLVGHTGGVWSSQMSAKYIISGSTDRSLKVWNAETGHCEHTLYGHTSTVRCMHLHGEKVVSGSRDATLRVWDVNRGVCLHVLVGHLAAVRCVQYDGKLVVSGAYDYTVKVWNPERQECLHTLQGHTNRVYSLQFDGIHVVSGSLDTSIRVWDAETGSCKHTLMGHQSLTSGMELRDNILVSGNADSTVKIWDIVSGQCLQTLSGPNKHQSAVTCLQFNSRFVITSSDDGTVKLWDVKTGEFIRNLVALESGGSGGVVWRIRASDTKLICAVGSRNGTEETKLMVLDFDVEGACLKCS